MERMSEGQDGVQEINQDQAKVLLFNELASKTQVLSMTAVWDASGAIQVSHPVLADSSYFSVQLAGANVSINWIKREGNLTTPLPSVPLVAIQRKDQSLVYDGEDIKAQVPKIVTTIWNAVRIIRTDQSGTNLDKEVRETATEERQQLSQMVLPLPEGITTIEGFLSLILQKSTDPDPNPEPLLPPDIQASEAQVVNFLNIFVQKLQVNTHVSANMLQGNTPSLSVTFSRGENQYRMVVQCKKVASGRFENQPMVTIYKQPGDMRVAMITTNLNILEGAGTPTRAEDQAADILNRIDQAVSPVR